MVSKYRKEIVLRSNVHMISSCSLYSSVVALSISENQKKKTLVGEVITQRKSGPAMSRQTLEKSAQL